MPNDSAMLARVTTAARLGEAAAQVLGALRVRQLEAGAVRDLSWRDLGRLMRVSDKTARDHAVEAFSALADWRAGHAVAPPPVIRFRNQPGAL